MKRIIGTKMRLTLSICFVWSTSLSFVTVGTNATAAVCHTIKMAGNWSAFASRLPDGRFHRDNKYNSGDCKDKK